MRFFTPGLYARYNSADDEVADRADEDWEAAIREHRSYQDSIAGYLPPRVRELSEELCLHDAELFGLRADARGPSSASSAPAATISVKLEGRFISLNYLLWGPVSQAQPEGTWPFPRPPVSWLFDEIDIEGEMPIPGESLPRRFWHRILLSDGRSIAVPFSDVIVSSLSPDRPETMLVSRVGL